MRRFARDAGVTVRALRLYDRLGLLKPAALTESGYRLYGDAELARLEQISALRFVGFSLEQIKELLDETQHALAERWRALVMQFTQGDAEIQRGLNRLWNDSTHWPAGFKRPWSNAADAFIKSAMNCDQ